MKILFSVLGMDTKMVWELLGISSTMGIFIVSFSKFLDGRYEEKIEDLQDDFKLRLKNSEQFIIEQVVDLVGKQIQPLASDVIEVKNQLRNLNDHT